MYLFLEAHIVGFQKTVRISEQIISMDKYLRLPISTPNGGYCLINCFSSSSQNYVPLQNGQLPESFKNMFFTGQEIHNYNTRNSNFFRLPSCRTLLGP